MQKRREEENGTEEKKKRRRRENHNHAVAFRILSLMMTATKRSEHKQTNPKLSLFTDMKML